MFATLSVPARKRLSVRAHQALVLFVVIAPLVACVYAVWLLWAQAVSWRDLALLAGMYVPISLGLTTGYHRMLAHRGFRAPGLVRFVLLVLGSMAIEGAPLDWTANHRKHHARSDREGDPHSPLDGLLHAHLGWLFSAEQADAQHYCQDIIQDRLVVFVDRTNVVWSLLSLAVPLALGGWSGLLWGGFVRTFLLHHATWSVNSVCHTFGTRSFVTADRSRNQWLVGLLALGEGWHNNHHAFPRSAIHGLDAGQLDASACLIVALERVGLVYDVERPTADQIARRRVPGLR
ncbi:MAG TPA: acyl-CoA desaturase [Chloroflexota bacterium]